MKKEFNTLSGFIDGAEPDEEIYFAYSASLRIFGDIQGLDKVSQTLGVQPTESYVKGSKRKPSSPPAKFDMWIYSPSLDEAEPLEKHINALWEQIKEHKDYLMGLKQNLTVDVFLGYRTNCDHSGIEVPHSALELFTELEIPFGVSIITG
jgi:hypothetical protein